MVKAQLEFNPDTTVKDINFCKFIRNKTNDKENLQLLLESVIIRLILRLFSILRWKARKGANEAAIIQGKVFGIC